VAFECQSLSHDPEYAKRSNELQGVAHASSFPNSFEVVVVAERLKQSAYHRVLEIGWKLGSGDLAGMVDNYAEMSASPANLLTGSN